MWLGFDERERSAGEHREYSAPFTFGCQTSEQGLFKTQYADGIMGLSMYHAQTLVRSWARRRSIPRPSFSLCLNRDGGHISLGGTAGAAQAHAAATPEPDRRRGAAAVGRHLTPMRYAPFARDDTWYYTVTVTSVEVGGHVLPPGLLPFVNARTIVDSGTTDTFISHKLSQVSRPLRPFARNSVGSGVGDVSTCVALCDADPPRCVSRTASFDSRFLRLGNASPAGSTTIDPSRSPFGNSRSCQSSPSSSKEACAGTYSPAPTWRPLARRHEVARTTPETGTTLRRDRGKENEASRAASTSTNPRAWCLAPMP